MLGKDHRTGQPDASLAFCLPNFFLLLGSRQPLSRTSVFLRIAAALDLQGGIGKVRHYEEPGLLPAFASSSNSDESSRRRGSRNRR